MNSIKTIVVVATLLAVGYGAHVFLSQPIPNAFVANESGLAAKIGRLPYFVKPAVDIPDELNGPISLPPLNTSADQGSAAGNARVDRAGTSPLAPVKLPSAERETMAASWARNQVDAPNERNAGAALTGQKLGSAPLAPELTAATTTAAAATLPAAFNGQQRGAEAATALLRTDDPTQHAASHADFDFGPPANRFEEIWLDAQAKMKNGQVVDALLSLSMSYRDSSLTTEQKDRLVPLLDELAGSVIYSSEVHMEAPYVVAAGDTLQSIAAEYGLSPEFVMRANQLMSAQVSPGQQLKVVRGPFRAELSVAARELTMYVGRYYAGRFPVAVGRDFPTNLNLLEVSELMPAREYVDPRTGERIAAGDPNNPYGEIWLGLRSSQAPELQNLGFHGCGSAIGSSDTRGCLSLNPQDVDDLRAILTVGSIVEVVP